MRYCEIAWGAAIILWMGRGCCVGWRLWRGAAITWGMDDLGTYHHRRLDCGIDFGAVELAGRRTAAFEIRVVAGLVDEPEDRLGLARVVEETITKGTERRDAQAMSDALDGIGAQCGQSVGRESMVFSCSCLPEYVEQALALHAETLRTPSFPEEFCRVAVDLGVQELAALEDDPQELCRRLIAPHAYGDRLGRHELGTRETIERITREDIVAYWRRCFSTSRMQITVGGAVDVGRFARRVDELFSGFGSGDGESRSKVAFSPGVRHQSKELKQEQILMCWPGAGVTDEAYPVQRVLLNILGSGMSSRLFTEVREKRGLVYWVGAWCEHPRGAGMIFLGASTMPDRCGQTVEALLREVDRLAEDVTVEELDRAKVGIIARTQTHGELTRARLRELGSDLFHFGHPVSAAEKNAKVAAVTVDDIGRYLSTHPRSERCVMTLGPRALDVGGPR